jgi:hypothetical protein
MASEGSPPRGFVSGILGSVMWIVGPILKWLKTPKAWVGIVGTIVLFAGLGVIFSMQAAAFPAKNPFNYVPPDGGVDPWAGTEKDQVTINDYAAEGGPSQENPISLEGERIYLLRATLTWTDEPNAGVTGMRLTNQPDVFEMEVQLPDGKSTTKEGSGSNTSPGSIVIEFNWTDEGGMTWADPKAGTTNDITVVVTCTNAGDQTTRFDPFGLRNRADGGNDYSLLVEYVYKPVRTD